MTDRRSIGEILADSCSRALGRPLVDLELDLYVNYLKILIKWHKSQRLVGSDDPTWIVEHLVADSLLFLRVLPGSVKRLIDIGSGAGFPGIPLRIVMPASSVTLVEARQRRASFLRAVIRELNLIDTEVIDQRLESLVPTAAGAFDAAVMRCAGAPDHLLPLTLPLVRSGGLVIASGPPVRGQGGDAGRGRSRHDSERRVPEFERVVVPGIDGTPRQFLVARKS